MTVPLVSLEEAKLHLRIESDDEDDAIWRKLLQASAIILDYLKTRADDGWTDGDPPSVPVPGPVEAATLLMLSHLMENRGDASMQSDEALWNAVGRLLVRFRSLTLA